MRLFLLCRSDYSKICEMELLATKTLNWCNDKKNWSANVRPNFILIHQASILYKTCNLPPFQCQLSLVTLSWHSMANWRKMCSGLRTICNYSFGFFMDCNCVFVSLKFLKTCWSQTSLNINALDVDGILFCRSNSLC